MAKDRDWIDYANLGSNLFQNVQLSGVQNKLGALASAAALEQAKAEQEDRWREVVFQGDTYLRELRDWMDTERTGVLALATFALANTERNHLTSACFRSFEDKERLRSMVEGFKALVKECESGLSTDERAEAQLCAQYMENPAVIASAPLELAQQLGKARHELSRLSAVEKLPISIWRASVLPLLGSLTLTTLGAAVFFPCCFGLNWAFREGVGPIIVCGFFTVSGGLLFALMGYKFFRTLRTVGSRNLEVRKSRADAAEAARLRPAKEVEVKALQQRVDSEIAKERIRLEGERDALMAKVLKVGKNPLVAPAPNPKRYDGFEVVLTDFPAEKKIAVIKAIREIHRSLGLAEAKALVESAPTPLPGFLSQSDAEAAKVSLEAAGAKVEIR